MESLITLNKVSKYFEDENRRIPVLQDISFDVLEGEFLMLLGPSGSGKSTVLRLMAGLIPPSGGSIRKKDIRLGFIFQNFALFPWLTVLENVAFGLHMQGMSERKRNQIAMQQIKAMGLSGFEHTYPRELSGGMKQRVGIARALALNPDVIFLDEPFSALDSFTAARLRQDLLSIWEERKLTIVMVTHLIEEALTMADRILVLTPSPAVIEADIENTLRRPRNVRSKAFYTMADKIEQLIRF